MRIGLLALAILLFPAFAYAALININTADATLLDTLPGIGPSKAAAIIDYRTQHGLFVHIEDIQNVSGIGSGVTYTNIAPLITVGDVSSASSTTPVTASSTPTATSGGGASTVYAPPPSSISVQISSGSGAVVNVPLSLSAQAKVKGVAYPSARIFWSFGDGSSSEGNFVIKTYRYAGKYLITATASDGQVADRDELIVSVVPAQVNVSVVVGAGITIANNSNKQLDLSNWRLTAGLDYFTIPNGTILLQEASVLFPYEITRLSMTSDASLWYPNGTVAARHEEKTAVIETALSETQPNIISASSSVVQTIPSDITRSVTIPDRETTAIAAPTALPLTAAVGAAVPEKDTKSILRSPWTLGFVGVMLLAGAAFVFL